MPARRRARSNHVRVESGVDSTARPVADALLEAVGYRVRKESAGESLVATFVVHGQPVPKARPRFARNGGVYMPARYKNYLSVIANALLIQRRAIEITSGERWDLNAERYVAAFDFFSKNPLFADADNLAGAVMDGAIGVLWEDDRTVDIGHIRRHHDPVRPRCEMRVEVWR